jgi:hypothetical protein
MPKASFYNRPFHCNCSQARGTELALSIGAVSELNLEKPPESQNEPDDGAVHSVP